MGKCVVAYRLNNMTTIDAKSVADVSFKVLKKI